MILAIDPGPLNSAYVLWDGKKLCDGAIVTNPELLSTIYSCSRYHLAIEMIASYGMAVGQSVFETVFWIGRFYQFAFSLQMKITRIYRKECKIELCHSLNAKDSNIRQALIDRLGDIGTKKNPGPLYKIRGAGGKDIWSALAVAITCNAKHYPLTL